MVPGTLAHLHSAVEVQFESAASSATATTRPEHSIQRGIAAHRVPDRELSRLHRHLSSDSEAILYRGSDQCGELENDEANTGRVLYANEWAKEM